MGRGRPGGGTLRELAGTAAVCPASWTSPSPARAASMNDSCSMSKAGIRWSEIAFVQSPGSEGLGKPALPSDLTTPSWGGCWGPRGVGIYKMLGMLPSPRGCVSDSPAIFLVALTAITSLDLDTTVKAHLTLSALPASPTPPGRSLGFCVLLTRPWASGHPPQKAK